MQLHPVTIPVYFHLKSPTLPFILASKILFNQEAFAVGRLGFNAGNFGLAFATGRETQQCLNFLPLLHGQGEWRPTFSFVCIALKIDISRLGAVEAAIIDRRLTIVGEANCTNW